MLRIERVVAAALAGVVVSGAAAQDAVQWRVEDGGNGHWYTVTAELIEREAARLLAEERGGYLATPKSSAENDFLHARLTEASSDSAASCWLGLTQLPDAREPDGGWTWIDGSPLKWAQWAPGEPDDRNYAGTVTGAYLAEMYLGGPDWADTGGSAGSGVGRAAIEWSADCNGDGIVDYGQILDGTFADEDGDGVPDLCDAVQWRVEDGGNGHWYGVLATPLSFSWSEAGDLALAGGGYLAVVTTVEEAAFTRVYLETNDEWWVAAPFCCSATGPYLGGFRESLKTEWQWVNGEEWSAEFFCSNQPSNSYCGAPELVLHAKRGDLCDMEIWWGDITESGVCGTEVPGIRHALVEWSADCNGDGIVDYGQILDGTFADLDRNGVPDCCEALCDGDLNLDNAVNSADLGLLIAAWNTDGSIVAGSDINGDGTVNAADLGLLIGAWGDCGCR